MLVAGSSQACALGSAVSAAVLAGAHPDFPTAQAKMTSLKKISYSRSPPRRKPYDQLYALYRNATTPSAAEQILRPLARDESCSRSKTQCMVDQSFLVLFFVIRSLRKKRKIKRRERFPKKSST